MMTFKATAMILLFTQNNYEQRISLRSKKAKVVTVYSMATAMNEMQSEYFSVGNWGNKEPKKGRHI